MTAGIVELLLQSHAEAVDLLPALPGAWPKGRVQGLRARGGLQVELSWEDGRLLFATLTASCDGSQRIRYAGVERSVPMTAGHTYELGPDLREAAADDVRMPRPLTD